MALAECGDRTRRLLHRRHRVVHALKQLHHVRVHLADARPVVGELAAGATSQKTWVSWRAASRNAKASLPASCRRAASAFEVSLRSCATSSVAFARIVMISSSAACSFTETRRTALARISAAASLASARIRSRWSGWRRTAPPGGGAPRCPPSARCPRAPLRRPSPGRAAGRQPGAQSGRAARRRLHRHLGWGRALHDVLDLGVLLPRQGLEVLNRHTKGPQLFDEGIILFAHEHELKSVHSLAQLPRAAHCDLSR